MFVQSDLIVLFTILTALIVLLIDGIKVSTFQPGPEPHFTQLRVVGLSGLVGVG
jgi:hypothetical protein